MWHLKYAILNVKVNLIFSLFDEEKIEKHF